MTPDQLIGQLVEMENDLAAFYERLAAIEGLAPLKPIFSFMTKHSAIHAQLIANYADDARVAELNTAPLKKIHATVKDRLFQRLENETDLQQVCDQLAQAEDIISQTYAGIAAHYEAVSAQYAKIGRKFASLAEDERHHRDYIRQRMDGVEKPPDEKAATPSP